MLDLHVYSHLDPMDTIWMKGLHDCMSMAPRKWLLQRPTKTPSCCLLAECGNARQCAPMPSPRCMAAGLHRKEESGGLLMENDKEGSASLTVAENFEFATCMANSMPTARGGNCWPKIPDTVDKIKVLRAVKSNLEELRRGAGLNQLQIVHHPHPPTR
jgi:hypothetical protein